MAFIVHRVLRVYFFVEVGAFGSSLLEWWVHLYHSMPLRLLITRM